MSPRKNARPLTVLPKFILIVLIAALTQLTTPVSGGDGRLDVSRPNLPFQQLLDRHGIDLPLPDEGKVILVNLPAFELVAFEDGNEVFRSRVIVGSPGTPTPIVDTFVTSVRFRPTWRPTPSMVASGEYEDGVRPPGPDNPLGLAAVRLEPPLLVYLHDTNRRDLFNREYRALSHGCIRVERWEDLVAWVLDMNIAEVYRLANGSKTIDVPAPPIPVLIRYLTRFPGADGRLDRHPDIYRKDVALGISPEGSPCTI